MTYIIPPTLTCRTNGLEFRPAVLQREPKAPQLVQTPCPLCDARGRTSLDAEYNERQPQIHAYTLREDSQLYRLGLIAGNYQAVVALTQAWPWRRRAARWLVRQVRRLLGKFQTVWDLG